MVLAQKLKQQTLSAYALIIEAAMFRHSASRVIAGSVVCSALLLLANAANRFSISCRQQESTYSDIIDMMHSTAAAAA